MSAARLTRSRGMLALAASALLAACAAPGGETSATGVAAPTASVAAPHIQPPPTSVGTWVELGHVQAPWLAGDAPVPVSGPVAPTRVAGLRRDDGRWLAIVMVQRATGTAVPCPRPTGVSVATEGDGCLRLRRDADFDRWLERQHGVLHQWVESRGWAARPRAWVAYRLPHTGSQALEAHVLLDPALIEPTTRGSADFLAAGQPGLDWARALAAATRTADGSGVLALPALPFAPPVTPVAPPVATPAVVTAPPAARTPPPPPRPAATAPRRDRG
ncbi:MAG: hypothetical protein IT498_05445 [Rubrivivax sp.]|nr:hypothetical protein [Rubrivivax sp.]HOZ94281.1 hypothetical protein [Ottowia sp.]HQO54026.1 hypothetical protein [Ottowia sp.]HQQ54039.1 hypothetical protein [Ottowia sp.]